MRSFVQELKSRRVYRVALAYLVVGSAVVQLAGTILPMFHAPEWSQQIFVVLIAICFPMALMLAWSFDVKQGAIRKAHRARGTSALANQRRLFILGVAGSFVALCALSIYWGWHPWTHFSKAREAGAPPKLIEKSIAVLPFENLSDEKQTGYFVEGIQDEILTRLSKITDLKVISRTSVRQYNEGLRNLRAIARELGVAHVVEGTIQRDGDRVRLSVQLIDARTDSHLWADQFDRTIADVFAIQTEIAERVVTQLRAKLSPDEKVALTQAPTKDLTAYELYLRGRNLIDAIAFTVRSKDDLLEAVRLLKEAVQRDPNFLVGYCELAHAYDLLYFIGIERTQTQLKLAEAAVQRARNLQPDAGETHLAVGRHLYWGMRDYARAREELEAAKRTLPNDPSVLLLAGFIDRRDGRWTESTAELEQALVLDPKNTVILRQISFNYESLQRYTDQVRVLDRVLAISPDDTASRVQRANVEWQYRGDTKPLRTAIEAALATNARGAAAFADRWFFVALAERDAEGARHALAAMPDDGLYSIGFNLPKAFFAGTAARAFHNTQEAMAAFTAARAAIEQTLREEPDYAQAISLLGVCDAALGRKQLAIDEGKRAVEFLPVSKDALIGPVLVENLALIYAWTGEKDLACKELAKVISVPHSLNYGQLSSTPDWDDLRSEPCFVQLVASLAPR